MPAEKRDLYIYKNGGYYAVSDGDASIAHQYNEGDILTEARLAEIKSGDVILVNDIAFVILVKDMTTYTLVLGNGGYLENGQFTAVKLEWASNDDVNGLTLTSADTQPELVSGTNIKTINSESILGSGDIAISAGGMKLYKHSVEFSLFSGGYTVWYNIISVVGTAFDYVFDGNNDIVTAWKQGKIFRIQAQGFNNVNPSGNPVLSISDRLPTSPYSVQMNYGVYASGEYLQVTKWLDFGDTVTEL